MAYMLGDHCAGIDNSMVIARQETNTVELRQQMKNRIQKHLETYGPVETAKFSDVKEREPLTSVDMYA